MYTPASLLDLAVKAEARHAELSQKFPPGTIHEGRNQAREEMDAALACASWMDEKRLKELAHVGPFSSRTFSRGMTVRIRKGARIFSTRPSIPREGVELKRAQSITIHSVDKGYCDRGLRSGSGEAVVQGKVHWAGTGGYWRWTDINNVELEPDTTACLA